MDVEGTDGRERGEDQVRPLSAGMTSSIKALEGLRTQICPVLSGLFGGPHRQPMGAPSRLVPGCEHGPIEDRVRSQPWALRQEDARRVCALLVTVEPMLMPYPN